MSHCLTKGILTISVDLENSAVRATLAEQRLLDDATLRLLNLLAKYELPATWAAADPALSAATERIQAVSPAHEMAILGDRTWVGREAPRSRFSRELARRLGQVRAAETPVSTLVLVGVELGDQADLALKHGITAIRHATDSVARGAARFAPQSLRFGLWSCPVSATLPGESRWLPGDGSRAACAGIDQTILARGLFHLAIAAPALAQRRMSGLRGIDRVLARAAWLRGQGVLEIVTLAAAAAKLAGRNHGRPSRSILRPAA